MSETLLSIVIPTYNRLPELQAMLNSLLPQVEGKPVEILIADDCSTDDTWEWLQARFRGSARWQVFRMEKNRGPGAARNRCLASASGRYFLPLDSDFILMNGAIEKVFAAIRENLGYLLLFFPCLQYPALRRLGSLRGRREVSYKDFLAEDIGEVIPIANLSWMRDHDLSYPVFRAGGEGLLWAEILSSSPALFLDHPIVLYRTDVTDRICTLEYQIQHPVDLAAIADAMLELVARNPTPAFRSVRARKCMAAGAYHLLAGNVRVGRQRLLSAAWLGYLGAVPALAASFAGKDLFTRLFRIYRTRLARAYL
jgi:glycosyltransferase involved in cell wall biosynthesis